ncbi:MAG: BolA family transcriptional regulator [Gammaproteobacteria bacterium]|jgi:acid stress-induced BolA-like protein IbaG/YrbA|nr:MAG: BolA family transcriptional regulator [Gammaproteobacteria bacterium]
MQSERIRQLIEQALPASVRDISGDGVHFEAVIVSDKFTGKNAVQRHQLVYGALGDRMGREIHALSMQTLTPEEWERQAGFKVLNPAEGPRGG